MMPDIKELISDPTLLGRYVRSSSRDETEQLLKKVRDSTNSDVVDIDDGRKLTPLKVIRRIQANEERREKNDLYIFRKVICFYISESDVEIKENELLSEYLRKLAITKGLDGERYREGRGTIEIFDNLKFARYSKGYEIFKRCSFKRCGDFLYPVRELLLETHPLEILFSIDEVFNYLDSYEEEIGQVHYPQLSSEGFLKSQRKADCRR